MCREICLVAMVVLLMIVVGVCSVTQPVSAVVETDQAKTVEVDPNLVGWWELDEHSGAKAADASTNGNDAKVFGDTSWIPGVAGPNALRLVNGGVQIADSESLRPSVYTLCVWLYIPGTDIKAPILEKNETNKVYYG